MSNARDGVWVLGRSSNRCILIFAALCSSILRLFCPIATAPWLLITILRACVAKPGPYCSIRLGHELPDLLLPIAQIGNARQVAPIDKLNGVMAATAAVFPRRNCLAVNWIGVALIARRAILVVVHALRPPTFCSLTFRVASANAVGLVELPRTPKPISHVTVESQLKA